ncbi:hypothetical protein GGI43DRAFT_200858 [Trichoderma evansii]
MASPNAFLPSPSRSAKQMSHFFRSSSPDLPVIGDIISPGVRIRPPRYGDNTLIISSDEEQAIKDGDKKKRFKTLAAGPTPSVSNGSGTAEDDDSSLCIIDPPVTHTPVARRNHAAPPRFRSQSSSPTKDQPWKKFKSATDNIKGDSSKVSDTKPEVTRTISSPQPTNDLPSVVETNSKRDRNDINEPLRLEPAMIRRLDWTPPSNKTSATHELQSSSALKDLHLPELQEAAKSFEQIVDAYKCTDSLQQNVSTPSGEGANVLGKRKLLELVVTTAAPAAPTVIPAEAKDRSPVKQKAPRKKPRTITEIATSAYRVPDPLQPVPVGMDDSIITIMHNEPDPATGEESKKKTRRKTTKATTKKKKKASPPAPILLPPTEALQEVARQDFVFGTSSQLAIENSPTFLRDLQAAMRRSNRVDYVDLNTTLNSDDIEPPEQKRLWGAGARDIDGDLFDLEINRIMEKSSQPLPAPYDDDDPFGYIGGDKKATISTTNAIEAQTELLSSNPFINANEALSNGSKPIEIMNDDSVLADSEILVGSPLQKVAEPADRTPSSKAHELHDASNSDQAQHHNSKPSFELFTDAQLSKEVASYGFKAIKSRQAKISLLEQCWQSKSSIQQPNSMRTFTTSAATGKSALDTTIQTPRGRPRKNSASSTPEIQEPPPSAQPPVSPSKPRGRPKKSVTAAKRATAGPSKGKKATPKEASTETPTTRKRKPKATKVIMEIPDSASDSEHSLSSDPASSPGLPFSQPRIDLSISAMDDTDLNLSGDQSLGYEYITKAVQSAPRTKDPTNPSWHEKILLYDPIVLEDFTTWLNCGQLTRVGFDGEVSTMEVKQWCESKSICCLWKVNLRGKERKRY